MTIFLTGSTGYIGSAVLEACLRAGHRVTALVRTSEKASRVAARGARPCVGDLAKPQNYIDDAAGHEVYVHTASESSSRSVELDRLTIETLVALAGQRPGTTLIYTSGIWVLGNTRGRATEEAPLSPAALVAWRPDHERMVADAAERGVRAIIVRPGIVYGGSQGIVADLFRDASNGLMRVVGTGENHWPLVYDRDLGDLYVRLATAADASGIYHATDEGDERVNDIVEAISKHTAFRPEIRHMPLAEARAKMGAYADALTLDQIVDSPRARALGWNPSLRSVSRNVARLFEEWRSGREAA